MNQLERWNLSRSLSSQIYDIYSGDRSFEEVNSANEYFPVTSELEVQALLTGLEELVDDPHSELQTIIHERIKTIVDAEPDETTTNDDVLSEWNKARSAATSLMEWHEAVESDDADAVAYQSLLDEHGEFVPPNEYAARVALNDVESDDSKERRKELTNLLREGDFNDTDALPYQIAEKLYAVFISHEIDAYSEVKSEFPDVVFPAQSVTMMETKNTTGSTKQDRITNIAYWVEQWCYDEEASRDLSKRSPRPMGMTRTTSSS